MIALNFNYRAISGVIDRKMTSGLSTTRSELPSLVPSDHEFFFGAHAKPQIAVRWALIEMLKLESKGGSCGEDLSLGCCLAPWR
jgi:hypothetical protein